MDSRRNAAVRSADRFDIGNEDLSLCRHGTDTCIMAHLVGCKTYRVCSSCNFLREKTLKSLTRLQRNAILGEPLLEEFPLTFSKMPRTGGTMSSSERRIAPRKIFSIPVRIRPLIAESLSVAAGSTVSRNV